MGANATLELVVAPRNDAETVRAGLQTVVRWAEAEGMALASLEGQLIRPMVSLAGWRSLSYAEPTLEFWFGALAVQLAHEASLLHDDVVDGAARRRGVPTLAATRGTAAALVQGDHLLTTAYRYAARTGSAGFVELFARAVERTVAGELAQARATGKMLEFGEYSAIACGKAGELLGCALALAPSLCAPERAPAYHALGCRVGLVYQMLDDLLDLTPASDTGKPALSDYAQGHWTWPLGELRIGAFGETTRSVLTALHHPGGGVTPIRRCLARYEAEVDCVTTDISTDLGGSVELTGLVAAWRQRARDAVVCEESSAPEAAIARPGPGLMEKVGLVTSETDYLARHSRSFRFATRFFPGREGDRVARVYAWCRFTDDLVDGPGIDPVVAASLLDEWMELSRAAYEGISSGIPFLDAVMKDMASASVPFHYAEELAEGMRMDLRGESYASMVELRRYTYRVASVVGLWISELFDVRDPAVLRRAEAMGHAMQLTNILRDVGEDLRAGRCYLPADLMTTNHVTEAQLRAGRPPAGYAPLTEGLIVAAEEAYRAGFEGLPELPPSLRLPVAVAAHVYRGILADIRRHGYDNLTRRARTSGSRKAVLATRAVLALR